MDAYGEWHAVGPLGEDKVVLIPGHTLEHALFGLLPAAQHRVVRLQSVGGCTPFNSCWPSSGSDSVVSHICKAVLQEPDLLGPGVRYLVKRTRRAP